MNKFVFLLLNVLFIQFNLLNCEQAATANEDLEDARLLVAKNVLNNFLVEGSDVEIRYNIYNIGNQAAANVRLVDENFPSDKFEYVSGYNTVRWARVLPHANVSHVAVVRPKFVGLLNLTHASVSYLPNEKSSRVQTGYSTEIGEVYVQRLRDYNRKFASHTVDWVLFVIMASPSILIPYFLWFSSKSKYERIESTKAKSN